MMATNTQSAIASHWVQRLDAPLREKTAALLLMSAADEGMLGYEAHHTGKVRAFVDELAARLDPQSCWLLQAETEEQLIYNVVMERWGNPTGGHIAEIKKAFVHPQYRGGLLVRRALAAILEKAEQEHIEQFVIDVRAGTRAEKLWRSLGFREFGRLNDYSRHLGQTFQGVYMCGSRAELQTAPRNWPMTLEGQNR